MKRFILFLLPLLGTLSANAWSGEVAIETPNTVLVLYAREGGDLRMAYYGSRGVSLQELRDAGANLNSSALPAFGTVDMVQLPALQVLHADGDLNLELKVESYELKTEDAAKTHIFMMQDKLQPVTVKVFYKAYNKVDIIETWTEIENAEKKPVTLKRYDSGHLVLRQGEVWITHMHGNWAAETEPTSEPLTGGVKIIRNTDGTRNAHLDAPEVMVSLDGSPQENSGRVIGAALCWSGNFELRFNTISHKEHHFYAGIDPQSSEYVLDPRQTFETPHLALTFSNEGLSGASRNFHRWARTEGMLHRGMKTGDILLNSWEGLYFNIDEARMIAMMDDISQFGGELFVMDDGWFGDKYPRKDDTSSLGDCFVFKIVDDLLTQNPEIAYIKWDANASIQNFGSLYLPKNRQQNLYVDYHLGLLKTLKRIRAKYPDIVIQDCASGGGRANYGLLPYFDEFWTSDNTDALQRVFIQWGTSLFFPANAMACHINHCPYWNTGGRVIPIKFRCDVAMSGRLGIELQPKDMTDEERKQTSTCMADYKQLRQVVQTGNLYRLISPYDQKGISSLMYVDDARRQGVLFVYKIANYYDQPIPRVRLAGLNPGATYTLTEKNVRVGQKPCALSGKRFTGRFLMEVGLEMPLREEYASRVFFIEN